MKLLGSAIRGNKDVSRGERGDAEIKNREEGAQGGVRSITVGSEDPHAAARRRGASQNPISFLAPRSLRSPREFLICLSEPLRRRAAARIIWWRLGRAMVRRMTDVRKSSLPSLARSAPYLTFPRRTGEGIGSQKLERVCPT